jgi:HAD superfamily hydrolase (TIGR01509 family)
LLLDFDGPICSVFAGYPASLVAAELRRLVSESAPADIFLPETSDPLDVMRAVAHDPGLTTLAHVRFTELELVAAETAILTVAADRLLEAALSAGLAVAVVSNNAEAAIREVLHRFGLTSSVRVAVGRDGDPSRLKPDAFLVREALAALDVPPEAAVLLGDAPSDVLAAHAAGVRAVGLANKPHKLATLDSAGAEVVLPSLEPLVVALRAAAAVGSLSEEAYGTAAPLGRLSCW